MKPPAGVPWGLLLLCVALPWGSGDADQAAVKDGSCPLPPSNPKCHELVGEPADECASDQQCPGEQKCCDYGCRLQCKKPLHEKAGSCPAVDRDACKDVPPAPAECQRDSQCPGSERCCCHNCTKACTETVPAHGGSCPKIPGHIGMVCTNKTVKCTDDSNCTVDEKCCHVPLCTTKCVKAVAENPGNCPIDPNLENHCGPLAPPSCISDKECAASEKCCLFGCGMQCVKALPEHDGFCPPQYPVTCTGEPILDCTHDSVCPADQKCCDVGCRRKCVKSKKAGKMGTCRSAPAEVTAADKCNKCNEDKDCPQEEKCCSGDQGRECQKPDTSSLKVRPGDCPVPYGVCTDLSPYKHTCNHDRDCRSGEKCCVRSCSRHCYPAVPVKAKPGTCPAPNIDCYENKDECEHDGECQGRKKCCYVHCGMQCVHPSTAQIGVCPTDPIACRWAFEYCDNDNDCWGYTRCCKFPCGAVCVQPVPEKSSS